MDPLTVIGGVAAVAQLIGGVAQTIKKLSALTGRYREADTSILSFIAQLRTVKAALSRIKVWAQNHAAKVTETDEEFAEQFDAAQENVHFALSVLEADVEKMVKDMDSPSINAFTRVKCVWNEDMMKAHKERLHDTVFLLNVLVQAVTCSSEVEKASLLHEPRTIEAVQKVKDDTSSLRTGSIRESNLSDQNSIRTSIFTDTDFPFDHVLTTSGPYQRSRDREIQRTQVHEQRSPIEPPVRTSSQRSQPSFGETIVSRSRDSALGSSLLSGDQHSTSDTILLAPESIPSRSNSNSRPYMSRVEKSHTVEQIQPTEKWRRPQIHVSPSADLSKTQSQGSDEKPSQRSRWSISTRYMKKPTTSEEALSPVTSSRRSRLRRRSDIDVRKSIDLSSSHGVNVPKLIQAAQLGSQREVEALLERNAELNQRHQATARTALSVAAHCGNDDIVLLLLQRDADPTLQDSEGMTPLHLAASRGHYRSVELLLQESVEVDMPGPERKTAFRLAADNGYLTVMSLLLQQGARVNARDANNSTALHAAARLGDDEVVNVLLERGVDADAKDSGLMSAIHHAASGDSVGHEAVIKALLAKKGKPCLESTGKQGMSPLSYASAAGCNKIAEYLVSKGANISHKDSIAMTPMHWAAFNGHDTIVDMLLSKKANIDSKTADGRTPLHLAVSSPSSDRFGTVELLIRRKANLEAQCAHGRRAIHYACESEDYDEQVIALLLGEGAKIDALAPTVGQPIHIAARKGSVAMLGQLLEHDAYADARDTQFDRPLTIACTVGRLDIVRTLLQRNVPVRARFIDKGRSHEDSPLCLASQHGHQNIAEELISRGASVWERDENGWQPLKHAAYYGHATLVQLLIHHGASAVGVRSTDQHGSTDSFMFSPSISVALRNEISQLLHRAEAREIASQPQQAATHTYTYNQMGEVHSGSLYELSSEHGPHEMGGDQQRSLGLPVVPDAVPFGPPPQRSFSVPSRPQSRQNAAPTRKPSRNLLSLLGSKRSSKVERANTTINPSKSMFSLSGPARPWLPHGNTFPSSSAEPSVSPIQRTSVVAAHASSSNYSTGGSERPVSTIYEQDPEPEWTPGDDVVACEQCQSKGLRHPDSNCDACRKLLTASRPTTRYRKSVTFNSSPVEMPG